MSKISLRLAHRWSVWLLVLAIALTLPPGTPSAAESDLPPLVFVARGHLATSDYIFTRERGPAGQLTSGLSKFAPGSKLLIRDGNGIVHVLVDTTRPLGDPLNPLGLRDVQSPDVSFDATRIVFAGTTGPRFFSDRPAYRPHFSWRLYEIGLDGRGLRQITRDDRDISIPGADAADTLGNAATYSFYDDLFPAYLADGRIVFSSSRYPSRAHYDGRPTFNLYTVNADGSGLRRITTERGGALHPTPLPDGRILWSRWWVNFNQPSDTTIYNRIDNRRGVEPARDAQGNLLLDARGRPIVGYRLPDNTLVYSNTNTTFNPARGRLPDGALIRNPPNTWHLMTVASDGTDLRRFAWTPRYAYHLTSDSGQDSFNAAQPVLVISGTTTLVAYTTQSDSTMAHTTFNTGIRVAYPGIDQAYRNTTESIAGYRWDGGPAAPPFALHPAGLPDGRILFSQTINDTHAPLNGTYNFTQNGKALKLTLQGSQLRYELRVIRPEGGASLPVALTGDLGSADAIDAKPIVVRPVGNGPGEWRTPVDRFKEPAADDPALWNVPRGLFNTYDQPAYTWSARTIDQIGLAILHNPNVYANPPLDLPYVNNSPALGSVAFADIYIDANQFTGTKYASDAPDDQVRAVKWTTVPVDQGGAFAAAVPADTPVFIVLRGKDGRVVHGSNRSVIAAAQGNAPGRPGQTVTCVGCHMGHVSGSLDATEPLATLGWTNIAPSAVVSATTEWANSDDLYYNGKAAHLTDRRNYVPVQDDPARTYQDRTLPWIAAGSRGAGQAVRLDWALPVAVLDVRLVGAEPGQAGFSDDYRVSGELRFFLAGEEIAGARQQIGPVAPLGQGGTTVRLPRPVAADRIVFMITAVQGARYGGKPPAALSEIEVIGQGATPAALAGRPEIMRLPIMSR